MSEFDELRRLRDADPVRRDAIPSADDPGPRALRGRIVMEQAKTTPARAKVAALIAAAAVAVAAVVGYAASRGGRPDGDGAPRAGGPLSSGSCVAQYSLDALEERDVAFAGTVLAVDGEADEVRFRVDESFKGVSGAEITLRGASVLGGVTSAGPGVVLEPGTKLLVSGDGGFMWGCGFTQPYDAAVAAQWRTTLQ